MTQKASDNLIEEVSNKKTEDDGYSKDVAAMMLAIDTMTNEDGIELKTDLNAQLIVAITQGKTFIQRTGSKAMKGLCHNFMVLRTSKDRKSREEITKIIEATNAKGREEETDERGRIARLLGR